MSIVQKSKGRAVGAVLHFQNYENLADVVIVQMLKIPSILKTHTLMALIMLLA